MVVRFFEIHVLPPLAASPGPYILCTRHRRQSGVRLRSGGTPVRVHSPRYTVSSSLRRLQAREVAPASETRGTGSHQFITDAGIANGLWKTKRPIASYLRLALS
jgi:hypothetical protein